MFECIRWPRTTALRSLALKIDPNLPKQKLQMLWSWNEGVMEETMTELCISMAFCADIHQNSLIIYVHIKSYCAYVCIVRTIDAKRTFSILRKQLVIGSALPPFHVYFLNIPVRNDWLLLEACKGCDHRSTRNHPLSVVLDMVSLTWSLHNRSRFPFVFCMPMTTLLFGKVAIVRLFD